MTQIYYNCPPIHCKKRMFLPFIGSLSILLVLWQRKPSMWGYQLTMGKLKIILCKHTHSTKRCINSIHIVSHPCTHPPLACTTERMKPPSLIHSPSRYPHFPSLIQDRSISLLRYPHCLLVIQHRPTKDSQGKGSR